MNLRELEFTESGEIVRNWGARGVVEGAKMM
jgi:hypothetical protein